MDDLAENLLAWMPTMGVATFAVVHGVLLLIVLRV
jgi:hypothetical protein